MSKTIAFACRVVVMLAFLITIPLIALFGKSLPDVAETVWSYWKKPTQENNWPDAEEAPPFASQAVAAQPTDKALATAHSTDLAALASNTNHPTTSTASLQPNPSQPTAAPLTPYAPTANNWSNTQSTSPNTPPSHAGNQASYNAYANNTGSNLAGNIGTNTPYTNTAPIVSSPAPPYGSQPLAQTAVGQPAQNSDFEQISKRLQQLGATYYRLESWGNGQPLFRFQCRMAIVGSTGLTRQFEATHQDPAEAMRQVLRQIEVWQESQRTPHNVQPPTPTNVYNVPNSLR